MSRDLASRSVTGMTRIGKVKIERNVYIGAKTTVLLGVVIGERNIIGDNSLANTDIPSYSLASGNSAKMICSIAQ